MSKSMSSPVGHPYHHIHVQSSPNPCPKPCPKPCPDPCRHRLSIHITIAMSRSMSSPVVHPYHHIHVQSMSKSMPKAMSTAMSKFMSSPVIHPNHFQVHFVTSFPSNFATIAGQLSITNSQMWYFHPGCKVPGWKPCSKFRTVLRTSSDDDGSAASLHNW